MDEGAARELIPLARKLADILEQSLGGPVAGKKGSRQIAKAAITSSPYFRLPLQNAVPD